MKFWEASAPSNIALIKYMGKEGANLATNPSLSMTLKNFRTHVRITLDQNLTENKWEPLPDSITLKAESTKRFLHFFEKLKQSYGIKENFLVQSGNNFPSDAGMASSASSFAALTLCTSIALSELTNKALPNTLALAQLSRTGSGSSCRSFFSPWCVWDNNNIYQAKAKMPQLIDIVAILDTSYKKVSSSEAHKRVRTSPLFTNRTERVNLRMKNSLLALETGNFHDLAVISWEEMWDMHSMFHTSQPPFFYFVPDTLAILRSVENFWEKNGFGPIATIDAGPNVHLLMLLEEKEKIIADLKQILPQLKTLESYA